MSAPTIVETPVVCWNAQRNQWKIPPGNGNPQLARWNAAAHRWEAVEAPSIALTLIISALFGIFGIIPAIIHSSAASMGLPTSKYWGTFAVCMVISIVLYASIIG